MEFMTVAAILVVIIIRIIFFAWLAINIMITISGAKESFGGKNSGSLILGLALSWGVWLAFFTAYRMLFISAYGG